MQRAVKFPYDDTVFCTRAAAQPAGRCVLVTGRLRRRCLRIDRPCIILARVESRSRIELPARYTSREVQRILGLNQRQLSYWARLRLVRPRCRWGERFYSFKDLLALRAIQRLAACHVPPRRLRRALRSAETQFGPLESPLTTLRMIPLRGEVAIEVARHFESRETPAAVRAPSIEPLTRQYVLPLDLGERRSIHTLEGRSADDWFRLGLATDESRATLPQAVDAYRRTIEMAPGWVAAHINLGTALFQISDLEGALAAFENALAIDASNPTIHFNLGCVLDDLNRTPQAIEHFRQTLAIDPNHADAHFNLAMALEKNQQVRRAREHWAAYLKLIPRGTWSEYARARLRRPVEPPPPIPFPRRAG